MRFVVVGDEFPCVQIQDILLASDNCDVVQVYTNTHVPSSRMVIQKATREGITVDDSRLLRTSDAVSTLNKLRYDWLINVNSTVMISGDVLETARVGALNMHPGLLPEYGGLHTHQWAILNGETVFGATIHYMVETLDAGRVIKRTEVPVAPDDTGLSLFMKCVKAGTGAMADVVSAITQGNVPDGYQQDLSLRRIYRRKDLPTGHIDWTRDAIDIERLVRSGNYEPFSSPTFTAHFPAPDGQLLDLLRCQFIDVGDETMGEPGTVIHRSQTEPPLVACGNGNAIALNKVRKRGASSPVTHLELLSLMGAGTVLP